MSHAVTGVYVGQTSDDARFVSILFLSGAVESLRRNDVTYVIPGFIDPDLSRLVLQASSDDRSIATILQHLRRFEIDLEEATRNLMSMGASDLYDVLHRNPNSLPPKSITSVGAMLALGGGQKLSPSRRKQQLALDLAMHRILMADPEHFLADPHSHRATGRFTLVPKAETIEYDVVREWVRTIVTSAPLHSFAVKAAKAKAWGVAHPPLYERPTLDGLKKYTREEIGIEWDKDDRLILRFLNRSLAQQRLIQDQPYMLIAPAIIKLVDDYGRKNYPEVPAMINTVKYIDRERVMSFLSEVGVAAPWENWVVQEADTGLLNWALADPRPRLSSSSTRSSSSKSSSSPVVTSTRTLSPTEFYPSDLHDSVRKDFGQLPVYTIDDATAQELDDGVSLETSTLLSPDGTPTHWVHVHIADPTALLHPDHEISQIAKLRDHTEYFPERTWGMLPSWFVTGKGMSLGSKVGGPDEKTLTISARLDERGALMEMSIHAGIVRRVKRLTYAAVNKVLGYQPSPSTTSSIVLTEPLLPPDYDYSTLLPLRMTDDKSLASDPVAVAQLTTLHRLAIALNRRRREDGALFWTFPSSSLTVAPKITHLDMSATTPTAPNFYATAPIITLRLPNISMADDVVEPIPPAQLLVSELMILANRVGAQFCVERSIPIGYRSQAIPSGSPENIASVLAARGEDGSISPLEILQKEIEFVGAKDGIVPGPHWPMGIRDEYGYTKVTSPLRRWSDMVSHWQIKSALLPAGSSSSSSSSSSRPSSYTASTTRSSNTPFTRSGIVNLLEYAARLQKSRGRVDRHASAFWSLYLLRAKLESPTADPLATHILENLTAVVLRAPAFNLHEGKWITKVFVNELGVQALLTTSDVESLGGARAGDPVKVRVQQIALSGRSRMAVLLRK